MERTSTPRRRSDYYETFSVKFSATETPRRFTAIALPFGSPIDCLPPSIGTKGMFRKTLKEQSDRVRILWQHDTDAPVGLPVAMEEREAGFFVTFDLASTPRGNEALAEIVAGTITDVSIGFDPIQWEMVPRAKLATVLPKWGVSPRDVVGLAHRNEDVRVLTEVRLWEISIVTFGAHPGARILKPEARKRRDDEQRERDEKLAQAAAWLASRGVPVETLAPLRGVVAEAQQNERDAAIRAGQIAVIESAFRQLGRS